MGVGLESNGVGLESNGGGPGWVRYKTGAEVVGWSEDLNYEVDLFCVH